MAAPDKWKEGANNTIESGGRKIKENKMLSKKKQWVSSWGRCWGGTAPACGAAAGQPGPGAPPGHEANPPALTCRPRRPPCRRRTPPSAPSASPRSHRATSTAKSAAMLGVRRSQDGGEAPSAGAVGAGEPWRLAGCGASGPAPQLPFQLTEGRLARRCRGVRHVRQAGAGHKRLQAEPGVRLGATKRGHSAARAGLEPCSAQLTD